MRLQGYLVCPGIEIPLGAWCLLAVIGSWSLGFADESWIELGPDPFVS